MGVDDGGDCVCGVVEAVDEFETQRDQKGDAEHDQGADGEVMLADAAHVGGDAVGGVAESGHQHGQEDDGAAGMRLGVQERAGGFRSS